MNPESPQFLTLFGVAWVAALVYVASFMRMSLRRRNLTGQKVTFRDAFFGGAPFTAGDLLFLFTGEHRLVGDAALSRMVLITRLLFAVSGALILSVFYLVFTGGAFDVG